MIDHTRTTKLSRQSRLCVSCSTPRLWTMSLSWDRARGHCGRSPMNSVYYGAPTRPACYRKVAVSISSCFWNKYASDWHTSITSVILSMFSSLVSYLCRKLTMENPRLSKKKHQKTIPRPFIFHTTFSLSLDTCLPHDTEMYSWLTVFLKHQWLLIRESRAEHFWMMQTRRETN